MNEQVGEARAEAHPVASTGRHKNGTPVAGKTGRQTPAEAGDITPTQSRLTSPLVTPKITLSGAQHIVNGTANGTADASRTGVDREPGEVQLHANASPTTEHTSISSSTLYDSYFPSNASTSFVYRTLTPKFRTAALAAHDGTQLKDMSDSSQRPDRASGLQRSAPTERQPQQQRGLHPYGYYTAPGAPEPGFARNPPSDSGNGRSALVHAQQPATIQHPSGFPGHYAVSPPPTSMYPQHHVQHQYSFPALSVPGMTPTAPHAHSHSPSDFYQIPHSASPTQPPLYTPPFHTSVPPEHTPSPALAFDYDGAGSAVRSPSTGAGSSYTPQQPFAPYGFHPTLTATPQFTHSHSPFSPAFSGHQTPQARGPQYPPSYTYMARASPASSDDGRQTQQQSPGGWWFIPPHGASPSAGPYPSMYYVDAYNNPSNSGLGQGRSFPALPSLSPTHPSHPSAFTRDPGSRSRADRGLQESGGESVKSTLATSPREPVPSSPLNIDEAGCQLSTHPHHQQETASKQSTRRPNLPKPPVQRSEWVMWVGNVPGDATHDELWRFFTRPVVVAPGTSTGTQAVLQRQQQLQQPPHLPADLLSPSNSSSASDTSPSDASGVQSAFLIARSNCAFVNYASAEHLAAAVQRFNGVPLRPGDPRCPRLVCRVRGKDEDLRAGVGAQRGTGIHTRWIREQREREKAREQKQPSGQEETSTDSEPPGTPASSVLTESGTDSSTRAPHHSSSSGSTTSGFLARYFPKRYFILKSLSQHDLDISVEKGVWATQPHNEAVLNQAYRNCSDVYLIFSVNKSGEFFGYARMAGPIGKAADRISWASRSESQHSHHTHSPAASFASSVAGRGSQISEMIPEENEGSPEAKERPSLKEKEPEVKKEGRPFMLFSPGERRLAEDSPKPVTPATQKRLSGAEEAGAGKVAVSTGGFFKPFVQDREEPIDAHLGGSDTQSSTGPESATSAPAVMGAPYRKLTRAELEGLGSETIDPRYLRRHLPDIRLDSAAPVRARRSAYEAHPSEGKDTSVEPLSESGEKNKPREGLKSELDTPSGDQIQQRGKVEEVLSSQALRTDEEPGDAPAPWGSPFKIEWLRVQKLPFSRTRHLRNPWNHEREVKVSRDGTELEPIVGQALLDEWDKEEPSTAPDPGVGDAGSAPASLASRRNVQNRRLQLPSNTESPSGATQVQAKPRSR